MSDYGFLSKLSKFINLIIGLFVLLILFIGFCNIISRYIFNYSPSWSDEIIRYLFVSLIALGISNIVKDREEICLEFWQSSLIMSTISNLVTDICGTIFFIIVSIATLRLTLKAGNAITEGLRIQIGYIYFIVFMGYFLSFVWMTKRLFNSFKKINKRK